MFHFRIRLFALVAVVALGAVGMLASSAGAASGGNSADAALCDNGGWQNYTRSDNSLFKNEGACVSYAAHGGTLKPATTPDTTTGLGVFHGETLNSQVAELPIITGQGCIHVGNILVPSPYVAYQVHLSAPTALAISMQGLGSNNGTLRDPELAFYSGAFDPSVDTCAPNLLATNGDGYYPYPANVDAHIDTGLLPAGDYTVLAFSWYTYFYNGGVGGYEEGTFTLTIAAV